MGVVRWAWVWGGGSWSGGCRCGEIGVSEEVGVGIGRWV